MPLNVAHTGTIFGIGIFLLIIWSILLGVSFDIVNPWEVGLSFDSTTRTIDNSTIYPGGRYFIGIGRSFVKYPITYQLVEFTSDSSTGQSSLTTNTKGGQTVFVDVSFYYRIDETHIFQIYNTYRQQLGPILTREAQDALKRICSEYDIHDFFNKRPEIATRMQNFLNAVLYPKYFTWIPLLQLRKIALPQTVEDSLVSLVIASQSTQTAEINRDIVLIGKDTDILENYYIANQTIAINEANAIGAMLETNAASEGDRIILETSANSWNNFSLQVGFNTTELITYNFLKYLKTGANSTNNIIVGFGGSVPIVLG